MLNATFSVIFKHHVDVVFLQQTKSKKVFRLLCQVCRFPSCLLQVLELRTLLVTIMGCVNGKPVLSEEDLDFIANHTAVSRDEVDKNYQNFLSEHPNGKITRREFRNMMQVCAKSVILHCLKINQNVSFEFLKFGISNQCLSFKIDPSGNTAHMTIFGIFNELLSTQNVSVARFARNVE